jgi:hypothetical protein
MVWSLRRFRFSEGSYRVSFWRYAPLFPANGRRWRAAAFIAHLVFLNLGALLTLAGACWHRIKRDGSLIFPAGHAVCATGLLLLGPICITASRGCE